MISPTQIPTIPAKNTPNPVSIDTAFVIKLAMNKMIPITIAAIESAIIPRPIHGMLSSPP